MSFLNRVLQPPTYGYEREGVFYKPSNGEVLREFFSRMNLFADRKNWLALWGWGTSFLLIVPFFIFLFKYFTLPLALWGFIYSMIVLGTHGTIYYHRYGTHRGYVFAEGGWGAVWKFITRNLVIKIIPEETYIVSHHVHHFISEEAGDPYNVNGGWLYCFLADVTHQPVAKDLSEVEYQRMTNMVEHTGMYVNSYAQYKKWGSLCHPLFMITHFVLNWAFWYGTFYLMGGHALAVATFGWSFVWAFGVRTFNYTGHGSGKDLRQEGIDFNRKDHSINQRWPGLITGEWHNNHHLYPNGARAGFLPYQLDTAWWYIKFVSAIGAVASYRDNTADFYKNHYLPYLEKKKQSSSTGSLENAVAGT